MKTVFMRGGVALSLLAALALFAGCSGKNDPKNPKDKNHSTKDKGVGEDDEHTSADGFWCNGHGVPELDCSMCQAKVEKECKAKGDWCEKHNRAQSQCFICNRKLKAKFDQIHQTRYGKPPPKTDDEKAAEKKDKTPEKKEK